MNRDIIPEPIEFEWNKGNVDKNLKKHGVKNEEAEEVFLNDPLIYEDLKHSELEKRYDCLGKTDKNKKLFISFTLRDDKIRIISARLMSKKERKKYEQAI
ncbi:MAG: BrnT family toxin [Patescibacteria group bacterium]